MPFPYARLIVGTRHCRVLISGNINSDATGIDISPVIINQQSTVNSQQSAVNSHLTVPPELISLVIGKLKN